MLCITRALEHRLSLVGRVTLTGDKVQAGHVSGMYDCISLFSASYTQTSVLARLVCLEGGWGGHQVKASLSWSCGDG